MLQLRKKESYSEKMQKIKVNSATRYFKRKSRRENKRTFLKKKTMTQVLKENEQKNNFEKDLKYEKKCVSFTTYIYRSLHSMTLVTDKKTEKIKNRSTFDQRNFMLKFIKTRYIFKNRTEYMLF